MKRGLRRHLRKVLGRTRGAGDGGPPVVRADPAADHLAPARDLAVVIPSPPGAPPGVDAPPIGRLLVERRAARLQDVTLAVMQQGEGDDRPLGEILVDHGATTAAHVVEALEHQAEVKREAAATSVRVDIVLLETLEQLVAELAEAHVDLSAQVDDGDSPAMARLERVCAELHDTISRMQRRVDPDREE